MQVSSIAWPASRTGRAMRKLLMAALQEVRAEILVRLGETVMSSAKRSGVSRRSASLWVASRPKGTASLLFCAPSNGFPTMSERRQPTQLSCFHPGALKSAWLQAEARAFARDVVLPIADELDRKKGEMPRSLIDEMGARAGSGSPFLPRAGAWASASSNTASSRRSWRALGCRSEAFLRAVKASARRPSITSLHI